MCDLMFRLGQQDPEPSSYEFYEYAYDVNLRDLQKFTELDFAPDAQHRVTAMALHSKNPTSGEKYTEKQLSAIEAHEKGHAIRRFSGPQFDEYFRAGLDISKVRFSDGTIWEAKKILPPTYPEDMPDDLVLHELNDYFFSGMEIAERMNQLKNYFGFRGTEQFTKRHLEIAKEHHVSDMGFDNYMSYFLSAITPEKEDKFLEIINNSGI